ncbi:MAG: type II secretion system ATPase GspE [Gammaproteobacteria bacterium]|nr:type II secretion system ATPase GspE [Gammaproteobacteria bacterium]
MRLAPDSDLVDIALKKIPFYFAKRHGVALTSYDEQQADVVYTGALKSAVFMELRRFLGLPLQLTHLTKEDFEITLAKLYEAQDEATQQINQEVEDELDLSEMMQSMPKTEDLLDSADDAPIIRLINALLSQAIKTQASDIHIEPFEDKLVIRYRIDGVLREMLAPQRVLAPLIISRIKVMAKLDIAEKRLPQDGRIALKIGGRQVDVRVSTMPSGHGERVVLRLLDKQVAHLDLNHLGMGQETQKLVTELIAKPHGIILITGPTGSGKTTSLYAMLTSLNEPSRNILTVEDPIEYYLQGIGQTQVNHKVNMTFAKGLRAMLRQDPDVVMIGEIRDLETAEIAVQASLTGHLVLSTLHTNTAIGAITRLKDMGVEPFLLASSLIGVAAQRLVRVLCSHCKQAAMATPTECDILKADPANPPTIYHTKGCDQCNYIGYRGRTGIYELIAIKDDLREMIHSQVSEQDMDNYCRKHYPSIRQDGMRRILAGQTTMEEVLRVTNER